MKRVEYPRPQLVRKDWVNLNGEWLFKYDDENIGIAKRYFIDPKTYDKKIEVPFVYQSEASGINDKNPHDVVWYYRDFEIKKEDSQRALLHFGAVDYEADVFINGQHVFNHKGGHTSFEIDITDYLVNEGKESLSVRAFDPHRDESLPRGKQFWEDESAAIWYTNSTGIWQTVWLEMVSEQYIQSIKATPLFDEGKVELEIKKSSIAPALLDYCISFRGKEVSKGTVESQLENFLIEADLFQGHIFRSNFHYDGWAWTPENPNLFDVKFVLRSEKNEFDEVSSYFGMRKIEQKNGMVYLNNKPYYQKLVLDQGYWPTSLLTAPSDEAFKKDIELAKEMGFNGCRKHQKTEDPRFLYWADQLGYLVWGECAAPTIYTTDSASRLIHEWAEIVSRDYNHPSIITWVPINESWGVPNIAFDRQQQHFSQTMYHYLHALDKTRLVISNDGWAMTETDICAIHNYQHGQAGEISKYNYFKETLSSRKNLVTHASSPWPIFAENFAYEGQPVLLTEFGGIAFDTSGQVGWGYTSVTSADEFLKDYSRLMEAIYASQGLWGYCYTQITDVEQEINGLLTYNREPKCDLSKIREINSHFHVLNVE